MVQPKWQAGAPPAHYDFLRDLAKGTVEDEYQDPTLQNVIELFLGPLAPVFPCLSFPRPKPARQGRPPSSKDPRLRRFRKGFVTLLFQSR